MKLQTEGEERNASAQKITQDILILKHSTTTFAMSAVCNTPYTRTVATSSQKKMTGVSCLCSLTPCLSLEEGKEERRRH